MKPYILAFSLTSLLAGSCVFADPQAPASSRATGALRQLSAMPLGFEPNRGQAPAEVDYISSGFGSSVSLRASGATLNLAQPDGRPAHVEMRLVSAAKGRGEAFEKQPGAQSYYIGNDSSSWLIGVPKFSKVRYANVYRNIDVLYYGNGHRLEYDFILRSGADPSTIRLRFTGANALRLEENGDLRMNSLAGPIALLRPSIYQNIQGSRKEIAGRYILASSGDVQFEIGPYNHSQPLIIDPILAYSDARLINTLNGNAIVVDKATGTAYIGGAAMPPSMGNHIQGFLYTISPTGGIAGFTLGGTNGDTIVNGVALDASGNVYLCGYTTASNLTQAGFQSTYGDTVGSGNTDAFMAKFTKPGQNGISSPLYSTYIGGAGNDRANAIAVDASGFAYVVGTTAAANFPRTEGSTFRSAGTSAFLTKIDPTFPNANDQRSLVYSRYIGGTGTDVGLAIALDGTLPIVGGSTTSSSASFLPTTATGFNATKTSASADGFIMKLDTVGATATYLTFSPSAPVAALAIDAGKSVYATGPVDATANVLATTASGFQLSPGGSGCAAFGVAQCTDAYLQKYNTGVSGPTSLLYGSYLGGQLDDAGLGVAVDGNGNAYIVGITNSANFPVRFPIEGVYQGGGVSNASTLANQSDGFIAKINTLGAGNPSLVYSTYLGGTDQDLAQAVALDNANAAYVVGSSASTDFPTAPGPQSSSGAGAGAFVLKVMDAMPSAATGNFDVNGDAREDVFIYSSSAGNQYALISSGNGSYSAVPTSSVGTGYDIVRQADLNGDHLSDIVYYNSASGALRTGIGNSTGQYVFSAVQTISAGFNVMERADFNNDGRTDLLLYRKSDGFTVSAISNGDGTFTFVPQTLSPGFTTVAVGDYNGDHLSDVIFYNKNDSPFNAYLGIGDGAGHFTFTGLFFGGGFDLYPADINADGKTDFLMYRPSDGSAFFAISTGTGFNYTYQLYSPGFTSVRIGDVNGDNFPDLVLYNANNALGYLGIGNGTANYTFSSLFFGPNFDNVELRDLNGDGKKDVIIYRSSDGTNYTGISTGTGFTYTYNYFGPGRTLAR